MVKLLLLPRDLTPDEKKIQLDRIRAVSNAPIGYLTSSEPVVNIMTSLGEVPLGCPLMYKVFEIVLNCVYMNKR